MKNKLLLLFAICFVGSVFAQDETAKGYHDRKYVIKYAPLQIFFGEVPFSFEHAFNDKMSYEVTLGPSFSNFGLSADRFGIKESKFIRANDVTKVGVVASAAFRFYPLANGNAPKGFFISPELKYRLFRLEYQDFDNGQFYMGTHTRNMNHFIVRFNVGYQFLMRNSFAMELFAGFGINSRNGQFPANVNSYDPSTQGNITTLTEKKYSEVIAHFTFGFRVGLGMK